MPLFFGHMLWEFWHYGFYEIEHWKRLKYFGIFKYKFGVLALWNQPQVVLLFPSKVWSSLDNYYVGVFLTNLFLQQIENIRGS